MKYKKKNGLEYTDFETLHRRDMRDPKFRSAYEALQPKYDLIRAILDARIKKGVTQAEVARRAGTSQSERARFESGAGNPTLEFLSKVSAAVGARIQVKVSR